MLRRICEDLELYPMLYQLSLLPIFYDILEEQKAIPCRDYENVVNFLTSLVRRMLWKMKSYPLLLVEVLFWKTRKECHYINCDSMLNELNSIKNKTREGRSGVENGSFQGETWVRRSIADALVDDDFEMSHQDNQEEDDLFEAKPQKFRQSSGERNDETRTSTLNEAIDGTEIADRVDTQRKNLTDHQKGAMTFLLMRWKVDLRIFMRSIRIKDSPDCCHIIAGELDPNGVITKKQVFKMFKHLGLKAPAKGKTQGSDVSSRHRDKKKAPSRDNTHPGLTIADESSSLRKPMHSRKRVHAFSVDQELKIRDLFEALSKDLKNSHLRELEEADERLFLCKADLNDYQSLRDTTNGYDGVFHTASPS